METYDAALKADKILELLIAHQPGLFSIGPSSNALEETRARQLASAIATLRLELTNRISAHEH